MMYMVFVIRSPVSRAKTYRSLAIVLMVSLFAVIALQLMAKRLAIPVLPSRAFWFIIAADGYAICTLLWLTMRSGKDDHKVKATTNAAEKRSLLGNLLRTLAIFAIVEAIGFGGVSLGFRIPLRSVLLPYVLFFLPPLMGLPLILHARQFFDRPKACAIRSAFGVAVFCSMVVVASFYSGFYKWLDLGFWTGWDVLAVTLFGAVVSFVSTFYSMYRRLTSPKLTQ